MIYQAPLCHAIYKTTDRLQTLYLIYISFSPSIELLKMKARNTHQLSSSQSPLFDAEPSLKDADRLLPIANVSRLMKRSLPTNAKISKEAKEAVQECVSEFISFITGEASDKCRREKRKTVNGEDLLWAMTTLGFENYVYPLELYLNKYKDCVHEGEVVEEKKKSFIGKQGEASASSERSFLCFNAGVDAPAPVKFMEFGVERTVEGGHAANGSGSGGGDAWSLPSHSHGV